MANVIEFMERMGSSDLRYAASSEVESALAAEGIDSVVRAALLDGDRQRLEALLRAEPNVCCAIFPVEGDERSGVSAR